MKGRKYTQAYLSRTMHDSVQFLLPFNLPGFFSFLFFCHWYLKAGCCLHHFVECQSYEAAAAMLQFVCWWIKPEALQNQMCLGVIVLFQPGGLLIRSGERSHSSLWSNRLRRSVWLCCSSSGQFENTFEKPLWILIMKVVRYQLIYCSSILFK